MNRTASRRRRVLAGVALVLACLSILITTVGVWSHQVAFNTDRFTALAGRVVTNPAVIDPLSARISTQVVDALDVQSRIEARLPDAAKPLAGALTVALRDAIDQRLQVALANPKLQSALIKTMSFVHARVMNLLRDKPDAVSVVDGYIQVEVFPVVGAALTELQSIGIIPPEVQLPDLSSPEAPGVLAGRLETALGITLPDDFGTIQLMPADRLLAARSVVRVFDLIVVALIVLSVVLIALALWLSSHRRRMVIYLGVGTIIAFLLARLAIGAIESALIGNVADAGVAGALRAMVDVVVADLRGLVAVILIATAIVAIAAYFWGRPRWAVEVASRAGDAAGRAGATASVAGAAGIAAAGTSAPTRDGLGRTIHEHRSSIERFGLAGIAFIVVWLAVGLEIALLGAALIVGFELVLRSTSSAPDGDTTNGPVEGQPTSET
jgi:hypothetical protein